MSTPVHYPEAHALVAGLVEQMRTVLGEALRAVYLYGSLATGDFNPAISDVDLLAVTTGELGTDDLAALHAMHDRMAVRYPAWCDRIEVAYLSQHALKTFRIQASPIAIISPGEPFHVKEAGLDWLINWWVVRRQGQTLFGPPPAALIDPITDAEFFAAVRGQAEAWRTYVYQMERRGSQAYAIVTLCRALYASTNYAQASKEQAARWAITVLPEWAWLIEDALKWRVAASDAGIDHAATRAATVRFVNAVADRIEAQAG